MLSRRSLIIHVGALAGVVAATLLTALVDRMVSGSYAVFLFFSAVVFVSASLSLSAGLLATAASMVAAFYFFFTPERTWEVTSTSGSLCALFATMNAGISLITSYLHRPSLQYVPPDAAAANDDDMLNRSSQLLGMVSHELRNRLAAMSMSSDLLLTQGKRLGEQDTEELIEEIRSDVERLQEVFDNLMALSRLGSGPIPDPEPCSLRPFVRELITRTSRRLEGVEIMVAIEPEVPIVSAVPTYLEQILRNLLLNARKYGAGQEPVELRAWGSHDKQVRISVRDHGPGVSDAELPRIFDAFYRSPASAGRAEGFGLGLPVSRRMAEIMNGRLEARLPEGGGLELVLTLPQYDD